MESSLVLIGSGFLVCLLPLAIYLLYISNLNSKPHPVMVSGSWDFTATLLGLSGFLLLSGPLLLTLIDSRWRSHVYGNWTELRTFGVREARAWSMMSLGYFLLLLGVIPGLIRSRRSMTSVYNIDAAILSEALDEAMSRMKISFSGKGPIRKIADAASGKTIAEVRIEGFRALNHSTIKWIGDYSDVRSVTEAELEKMLRSHLSPQLAIASWLNTAAMTILLIMLFWTVALVLLMFFVG